MRGVKVLIAPSLRDAVAELTNASSPPRAPTYSLRVRPVLISLGAGRLSGDTLHVEARAGERAVLEIMSEGDVEVSWKHHLVKTEQEMASYDHVTHHVEDDEDDSGDDYSEHVTFGSAQLPPDIKQFITMLNGSSPAVAGIISSMRRAPRLESFEDDITPMKMLRAESRPAEVKTDSFD